MSGYVKLQILYFWELGFDCFVGRRQCGLDIREFIVAFEFRIFRKDL